MLIIRLNLLIYYKILICRYLCYTKFEEIKNFLKKISIYLFKILRYYWNDIL